MKHNWKNKIKLKMTYVKQNCEVLHMAFENSLPHCIW